MQDGPATVGKREFRGEPKLLGLEVVRFACAMVVLIFHFQHFSMIGDGSGLARDHEPLAALLWPIYLYGKFGVEIFWCISGFIFYWKYADAIAARTVGARKFFWLRFSRLYPLHFVTLLAVAALQPVYGALAGHALVYDQSIGSFFLQLGLADQWAGARAMSFNGPIWSVSAEVFVYVLFFLVMRTFGRRLWLIVAAVALGLAALCTESASPLMACAGYFFAGGAAAEWMRSERARTRPREARLFAGGLIIVAIAFVAACLDLSPDKPGVLVLILLVCPPALFLLAQDMPWLDRWQRPIEAAGNLTYSTYLLHFPMQLAFAVAALAAGIAIPIGEAWFLAAYLAAVLIAGRAVFLWFESPLQDMIRSAALAPARTRATA
jgi:peptidoglycan/LPS O-acetylase OafA/YrhL